MQTASGTLIADGNAINVDIGFIPDYLELFELTSDPEIVYRWYRCLYEQAGATYLLFMYGVVDDGAGALSPAGDADNGFIPYNEPEDVGVMIEHPSTGKSTYTSVYGDYSAAVDYASVGSARSATAIGTIVRPTVHNGYVYELITTASGTDTEPTWPTTPGETVDAGYHVWICRREDIAKGGGLGFTIGATLSVDSDVWVFKAERHDRMGDMGDADGPDPLTFPIM